MTFLSTLFKLTERSGFFKRDARRGITQTIDSGHYNDKRTLR
tara:strand:- start:733 stop:858 length:126 start_codon:yes stop_codon:yes gene_type:complete